MGSSIHTKSIALIIMATCTLSAMYHESQLYNVYYMTPQQSRIFDLIDNDEEMKNKLSHYKEHFHIYNTMTHSCNGTGIAGGQLWQHTLYDNIRIIKLFMLHESMQNQRYHIAQAIIDDGVNINDFYDSNKTILHTVAKTSWTPNTKYHAMEFLLKNGATPHVMDANGQTPLHDIINASAYNKHDCSDIVTLLKRYNANINIQNPHGETPLHVAASHSANANNLIKTLLENGSEPNIQDKAKNTALHWVNNIENARPLIEHNSTYPNLINSNGSAPVHLLLQIKDFSINAFGQSARIPRELIAQYILRGAHIDRKDGRDKLPIHYAQQPHTVYEIAHHGGDVNEPDRAGNTLLNLTDDIQVAKACIQCGADVNTNNQNKETPLHKAAGKRLPHLCHFLLSHDADASCTDNNGKTPVDRLTQHGAANIDITTLYALRHHNAADIDATDTNGNTALHKLAQQGKRRKNSLITLISEGCDINKKNIHGKQPFDYAQHPQKLHILSWVRHLNNMEDDTTLPTPLYRKRSVDEALIMTGQGYPNKARECINSMSRNELTCEQYVNLVYNLMHSHAPHAQEMLSYIRNTYETPYCALSVLREMIQRSSPLQETYCRDVVSKYRGHRDNNGNTLLHLIMRFDGSYDNVLCRIVPYVASQVTQEQNNNPQRITARNNDNKTPVMIGNNYKKGQSVAALTNWFATEHALGNTTTKRIAIPQRIPTNNNKYRKITRSVPYRGIPSDILTEHVGKFITGFPQEMF